MFLKTVFQFYCDFMCSIVLLLLLLLLPFLACTVCLWRINVFIAACDPALIK